MRRFPGIVAALLPCLAACGKVERFTDAGSGPDAENHDADVSIDAEPPGQVTVTTYSRCCEVASGTLMADVEVFVVQPDGTLGDSGRTNASGTITLDDVQTGAGITAIYVDPDPITDLYLDNDVVTVLGVQPGDNLVFGEHYQFYGSTNTGSVTVQWPLTANTSTYYVYTPCGSNSVGNTQSSLTIATYDLCQTSTGDVVVLRTDATTGQVAGAYTQRDVNFMPGAVVTPGVFAASNSVIASVSGLPVYIDQVRFDLQMNVPNVVTWGDSQYVDPVGGAATTTAMMVPAGGDSITGAARLERPGEFGRQENIQSFPAVTSTAPFTMVELPWLGDRLVSASAQYATWVQVGAQPYDGAVARTRWNRYTPGVDGGEGYYTDYDWTLLMPPGITTYTWADTPAELAPHLPALGDGPYMNLKLIDLASSADYVALRSTPEWLFADPRNASYRGELTGRATVSYDGGEGGGSGAGAPMPLLLRAVQGRR